MRQLFSSILACLLLAACGQVDRPVVVHARDAIPDRLSEWGVLFADGRRLAFNDRVLPYDLNTPLFSDYALKLRTVWVPQGTSARYNSRTAFEFPVGTIISKTFHYAKTEQWSAASPQVQIVARDAPPDADGTLSLDDYLMIETRLLVRYEDGWKALPYVWNTAQDEAYLALAGDLLTLELVSEHSSQGITYVVPDANQCGGCHTPNHNNKELLPLGPRAWQLNRSYDYVDASANQIEHWQMLGMLHGVDGAVPRGVDWSAPGDASLEQRAKAYLDANCAHCHNADGAADTSALHLNIDAPVDRHYGICKTPVAVGRGSGDRPYDIYPGRPEDSILLYRMQNSDPAIAMPELGRSAAHAEAVALIRDWIAEMNGEC